MRLKERMADQETEANAKKLVHNAVVLQTVQFALRLLESGYMAITTYFNEKKKSQIDNHMTKE